MKNIFKIYLKKRGLKIQKSNLGKKDFCMDYEAFINWYVY
jgi:hypothetical protein